MMRRFTRLAALLMTAVMLNACANPMGEAVPELIEPKGSEIVYEQVERRDVGNSETIREKEIYVAIARPRDYAQFFVKNVTIDEIKVEVGDYVHEGDLIATVDVEDIQRQIQALQNELAYRASLFALDNEKAVKEELIENLRHKLTVKDYQDAPDSFDRKSIENMYGQLSEFEENQRLNEQLYEFNVRTINEEIGQLKKQIENTGLLASHDGYIAYIKDLNDGRETGPNENVAVIVDMDDTYLEIPGMSCQEKVFLQYDECFCVVDGVRHEVTEAGFGELEYQIMQSKKSYANVRIRIEGIEDTIAPGTCYEIVFRKNYATGVLAVKKDAVQEDSDGTFVYVRTENGDERRNVIVGQTDIHYSEIIEGLSEGEEVLREVNPFLDGRTVVDAGIKDVVVDQWKNSSDYEKKYFAKESGIVDKINVSSGEVADKAEIFTIKTTGARTEAVRLQNEIENNALNLADSNRQCDEQIENYDKARYRQIIIPQSNILEVLKEMEEGYEKEQLEKQEEVLATNRLIYDSLIESVEIDKRINELTYQYKDNQLRSDLEKAGRNLNSEGTLSVCTSEAGSISKVIVKEGSSVNTGDHLFNQRVPWSRRIVIYTDEEMGIGMKVVLRADGKEYTGEIFGFEGSMNPRYHTTVRDNMVYLTADTAKAARNVYYVRLDDEAAYDNIKQGYECFAQVYKYEEYETINIEQ